MLHEIENVMPSLVMTGVAHCNITEPLPTSELIIFSLTAMALIVTLLTFSHKGAMY